MPERQPRNTEQQAPTPDQEDEEIIEHLESEVTDNESADDSIDADADPKSAIDAEPDAEIRHTDAELLGRRYPVRQAIRSAGNQRMRAVESAQATWKNALDTPKKMRLGLRTSLAEGRVARHQARVAATEEGSWVHQRRTRKLERVTAKRDRVKQEYKTVAERMKDRRTSVKENFETRKGEYVKELKDRAELARSRKALRHELKDQGAGFIERRAIVKDAIKNNPTVILEAIGDTSSIATMRNRELKKAERAEKQAQTAQTEALYSAQANANRANEYATELRKAVDRKGTLSGEMAKTTEKIEELRAKREELDETDPQYFTAGVELREAERTLEEQTAELEEVDHAIKYRTEEVERLAAQQERLNEYAKTMQEKHAAAQQTTGQRRQAANAANQAQQEAAHKAVGSQLAPAPDKKKKEKK